MIHVSGIRLRTKTVVKAIEMGRIFRTSRGKKSISVIFSPFSEW
jgi:hypothetical protein